MQTKLFINGKFVDAIAGGKIAVLNPYDNSLICEVAEAREADVDAAVEAAKAAQKSWGRSDASQRGRLLTKLADAIEALTYPGFLRLAQANWSEGLYEILRSLSKAAFVRSLQKLIPEVQSDDLVPSTAGVRAQAVLRASEMGWL